jgi:hypothetical protein
MRVVWFFEATAALVAAWLFTSNANLGWAAVGSFAAMILLTVYRNVTAKLVKPRLTPVPAGKIRICVAGYTHSSPTASAHYLADKVARAQPGKYESWYFFDQYTFFLFTAWRFSSPDIKFPAHLKGHATSPFCWLEEGPNNKVTPIGGSDDLREWVLKNAEGLPKDVVEYAKKPWSATAYLTPYFGSAYHYPGPKATASA